MKNSPSPTGRAWRAPRPQLIGARPCAGSGPLLPLLAADFATIERRLLANMLATGARPPGLTGAALADLDAFCVSRGYPRPRAPGPALVSRPPRRRDVKPDNVREPAPAPFEVTCQDCGGRGWKQPSMVVGFHPQRCGSCGGTGKVTVR